MTGSTEISKDELLARFQALLAGFNVKNYADSRNFGVEEWAFVLSRRRTLGSVGGRYTLPEQLECIGYVLSTPVLTEGHRPATIFGRTVRDLTVLSAWTLRETVSDDLHANAACEGWEARTSSVYASKGGFEPESDEWVTEMFAAMKDMDRLEAPIWASFNDLLGEKDGQEWVYAEVDLQAPDAVILADFKIWLSKMRQREGFAKSPVKRFTDTDLARWSQQQVLPYIDLTIAAEHYGTSIPNHVMGSMLFPDIINVDVSEKVRKTVAPMANELLSFDLLAALKAAANTKRLERSEGNHHSNPSG